MDDGPLRATTPGQFVLAGSTRFLSTPSLSESLAGRAGLLELWPFAESELAEGTTSFLSAAFTQPKSIRTTRTSDDTRLDYFELICCGSYPEPVAIRSQLAPQRRPESTPTGRP